VDKFPAASLFLKNQLIQIYLFYKKSTTGH